MASLGDALGSAVNNALTGPVKSFNDFMGRINSAITDPLGSVGDLATMAGLANPYAKQNTLQVMQGRGEPVLSFDWLAVVVDPNPSTSIPWYFIDTLTTPGMQVGQQELHFNGINKKYAGQLSVDSVALGLFTDSNAATFNYAYDWFTSTVRTDGFYNLPSKYKRDVILYVLDAKRKTIIDIRFVGCWPTSYDSYSFDAQNNIVETRLTLSVDQVIFNTETSLTKAVDRYKGMWPGMVADAGSTLLNIPSRR